jgi:hypothetical protein
MTRDAVVAEWQFVTDNKGSDSDVSVPILIEQILNKQYPRIGNVLQMANQE